MHTHRIPNDDDDLLIPESVAVRKVNRLLGTSFATVKEIGDYLNSNPEVRKILELEDDRPQ
jgi:hypothetical protein